MAFGYEKEAWQLVHENERLRDEIARLRLTDAERYAIDTAINCCRVVAGPLKLNLRADEAAATLRGLLERTRESHTTQETGSKP